MRATRDGRWWVLEAVGVPGAVSQVASLSQAETWIKDAIALALEVPEGSFDVLIEPELAAGRP